MKKNNIFNGKEYEHKHATPLLQSGFKGTQSESYKQLEKIMKINKTQDECHKEWNQLRQEILIKIEQIDQDTPFSETEPKWWLEMSNVRRIINYPDAKTN